MEWERNVHSVGNISSLRNKSWLSKFPMNFMLISPALLSYRRRLAVWVIETGIKMLGGDILLLQLDVCPFCALRQSPHYTISDPTHPNVTGSNCTNTRSTHSLLRREASALPPSLPRHQSPLICTHMHNFIKHSKLSVSVIIVRSVIMFSTRFRIILH